VEPTGDLAHWTKSVHGWETVIQEFKAAFMRVFCGLEKGGMLTDGDREL
jgi:hypothetical protein